MSQQVPDKRWPVHEYTPAVPMTYPTLQHIQETWTSSKHFLLFPLLLNRGLPEICSISQSYGPGSSCSNLLALLYSSPTRVGRSPRLGLHDVHPQVIGTEAHHYPVSLSARSEIRSNLLTRATDIAVYNGITREGCLLSSKGCSRTGRRNEEHPRAKADPVSPKIFQSRQDVPQARHDLPDSS
jgi:hypothetical protein